MWDFHPTVSMLCFTRHKIVDSKYLKFIALLSLNMFFPIFHFYVFISGKFYIGVDRNSFGLHQVVAGTDWIHHLENGHQ